MLTNGFDDQVFAKNPDRPGSPISDSDPIRNVTVVSGILRASPPMSRMSFE